MLFRDYAVSLYLILHQMLNTELCMGDICDTATHSKMLYRHCFRKIVTFINISRRNFQKLLKHNLHRTNGTFSVELINYSVLYRLLKK